MDDTSSIIRSAGHFYQQGPKQAFPSLIQLNQASATKIKMDSEQKS
jgi:hypothetical protein